MKKTYENVILGITALSLFILVAADTFTTSSVALAIWNVASFMGIVVGGTSLIGRFIYKTQVPFYMDGLMFIVGTLNIVQKFFALF